MSALTLGALLNEATSALAGVSDAPRREAELLIEHALGHSRARLRATPELPLEEMDIVRVRRLLQRRRSGEPIAYILGEREFWSLPLQVGPAVLIPRPETELVVERALLRLPQDQTLQVLDLGTGSGAIALAIAHERPLAKVIGTDASAAALDIAEKNAGRLKLANAHFVLSDWYAALPAARFDLIASNPPYIAEGDPELEPAVLASEPRTALISGASGLEALQAIVSGAAAFLRPSGWLVLEHGWRQAAAVRALLVSAGFSGVASHADLAGHERVTEGQYRNA